MKPCRSKNACARIIKGGSPLYGGCKSNSVICYLKIIIK